MSTNIKKDVMKYFDKASRRIGKVFSKEQGKGIHYSLRFRMALIMTITVVIIIIAFWGANKVFLPAYYQSIKIAALEEEYKKINEEFTVTVSNQFDNKEYTELESLYNLVEARCDKNNMDIFVFSSYNLGDLLSGVRIYYPLSNGDKQYDIIRNKFDAYNNLNSSQSMYDAYILKSNDMYVITKMYDKRLNSNSIELVGTLESGLSIIISANFESMQESASISNTFLAYIGIIAAILASFLVFFISKSITKPILDISLIAERMAKLDFDARYVVRANDEIDMLGKSMNQLSDKLKDTISELKTANSELLKDIETKNKTEEMRKEFLSNVSHELKTPIALVQGYAEGLSDNINDDLESRQFYCDVIVDEARKMNNIVMKILDLNNIESGNNPVSIERFDIIALIKAVISSTDILIMQKEAKTIFDADRSVYVWADEFMIEEVLNNYLSNALNHIDGEKIIKINVEELEDTVRIKVFNTGKNIPEEDIDKVWGKFYKVDKARTREYGGSGVGLSIVKAIMDSHGKECGVNNKKEGVEFWIELDGRI